MGVPDGVELESNDAYDPTSPSEVWYEMYTDPEGNSRFVYLDADVRESLDLWVQQQLRVVDAGLPAYRKYASELFLSDNEKDRSLGTVLILIDQATYDIEELVYAACSDCEFIDNTVKLLGRKFICDPDMLDYLTEKVAQKEPEAPLFTMTTMLGEEVLGIRYLASIFQALKMNPRFIRHWHANHQFSRIVHRMASQRVPMEQMEELAYNELARVLATSEDVRFLIDYKVRDTLFNNYPTEAEDTPPKNPNEDEEQVEKSLKHVPTDDFGVAQVWSDLTTRRPDERDFSEWLHSEPLHEVSPEQQEALDETEEVKKDFDRLRSDGTLDVLLMLQAKQAPQPQATAEAVARAMESVGHDNATRAQAAQDGLHATHTELRGIQAMLTAFMATRAESAPSIHITNPVQAGPVEVRNEITTPQPNVTVHNQVQPTAVEVRNEITTPQPSVTVHNEVQPAQVAVDVRATMPARISETTVERGDGKNITRSVTIERDA